MGNSNKGKHISLIKDTFVFSIGKIGSRAVLFFLVPLYTNFLTKSEYGTTDLVFTISQLLSSVFAFAIFDSVVRFGLVKDAKKQNVIANAFIVLGVCAILSIAAIPVFSLFKSIDEWKYYLSAMIILIVAVDIEMNYLKVIGNNLSYSIISIVQAAVLAISNIVLIVHFRHGIDGYLMSSCISYFFCAVLAFFSGHIYKAIKEATLDLDLLKQMLMFSTPLILNNISWWVIQSSDRIMVEAMISAAALGLYTAAAKIPSLINVAISVFQQAWGISSIKEIESTNETSFYSEVLGVYSSGVFLCCILLNAVVKPFMYIYVGEEFRPAWVYAPLLVASAGFSAISAYYGSLYGAIKKPVNNMMTTLVAAIVNLSINLIFIRICGVWGAIIGTVTSYVLISFIRMIDISRYIKIQVNTPIFVLNSLLVLGQAIFVSLDCHVYLLSAIIGIVFVTVNIRSIKSMWKKLFGRRVKTSKG